VLQVTSEDRHELRIKARTPDRQGMADEPQRESGKPHLQTQPDRRRQRSVADGHCAWRTAEQDRVGERAMQRHLKAFDHATTAPPAKLKNVRKNDDAANAIDSPKTI